MRKYARMYIRTRAHAGTHARNLSRTAECTHWNARSGTQRERNSWSAPPKRSIPAERALSSSGVLAGTQPESSGTERRTRTERASQPR
eukprot:9219930-Alexandrium_andersonii.AAC.1